MNALLHLLRHRSPSLLSSSVVVILLSLSVGCGDDRSGEQPFAPTVVSRSATVVADSVLLAGEVTASPNSTLLSCGYVYGNDTLAITLEADTATTSFEVVADSLEAGTYYAVAFAKNGVGTSYGDTLHFTMP